VDNRTFVDDVKKRKVLLLLGLELRPLPAQLLRIRYTGLATRTHLVNNNNNNNNNSNNNNNNNNNKVKLSPLSGRGYL
jgi:hypothetical protein